MNFLQYILDEMKAKGHNVTADTDGARVNGIAVEDDGFIYANADHRKYGDVSGI